MTWTNDRLIWGYILLADGEWHPFAEIRYLLEAHVQRWDAIERGRLEGKEGEEAYIKGKRILADNQLRSMCRLTPKNIGPVEWNRKNKMIRLRSGRPMEIAQQLKAANGVVDGLDERDLQNPIKVVNPNKYKDSPWNPVHLRFNEIIREYAPISQSELLYYLFPTVSEPLALHLARTNNRPRNPYSSPEAELMAGKRTAVKMLLRKAIELGQIYRVENKTGQNIDERTIIHLNESYKNMELVKEDENGSVSR